MEIQGWQWDEGNLWKAQAHGFTPRTVDEVSGGRPMFRLNLKGRAATHQMIGRDAQGRTWTFCVLQVQTGLWRTITGWPSTTKDQAWYDAQATPGEE